MKSKQNQSEDAQGLRLVRAFLSLPSDKRAEVIAFVEDLVRARAGPEEGYELSPT